MVDFVTIPDDLRVPGRYFEILSGGSIRPQRNRTLLIAPRLTGAGTVATGTIEALSGSVLAQCGNGSILAEMALAFRDQSPTGDVMIYALADDPAWTAASATITVSAVTYPLGRGTTLDLWPCGDLVRVAVTATDTAANVAAKIATAINAGHIVDRQTAAFPMIATVAGAVVTLTARQKGVLGNTLWIGKALSRDGDRKAEAGIAITAFTGGAGEPDLAPVMAALGDDDFDTLVSPWGSTAALDALSAELERRWGWSIGVYGHAFGFQYGTFSAATTAASARDKAFETLVTAKPLAVPVWRLAGAVAGIAHLRFLGTARNRGVEDIRLRGITARAPGDAWTFAERDALIGVGASTIRIAADRSVRLERLVTTYKTDPVTGQADAVFRDVQTRYLTPYCVEAFRDRFRREFTNATADEDSSGILDRVRAACEHVARRLVAQGALDNLAGFLARLQVGWHDTARERVNVLLPLDLQGPLHIVAAQVTVVRSYADAA